MRKLFCLELFFYSLTIVAQEESIKTPQIAIKIALGEVVEFEGISIKFVEVLEDSRCPKSVQCILAGRARVKVLVTEIGESTLEKELIFGAIKENESRDRILCKRTELVIEAIRLVPYPRDPEEQLNYVLLIGKIKLN